MNELVTLVLDDASMGTALGGPAERDLDATRTLDLTEAALLEPDPAAERARLRTRGFVRARIVTWRSAEVSVAVTLYQLADPAQASLAVQDIIEGLRAAAARVGSISGLPGAVVVEDDVLTIAVTFDVAAVHAIVLVAGGSIEQAGAVALAQRHRLLARPSTDTPV